MHVLPRCQPTQSRPAFLDVRCCGYGGRGGAAALGVSAAWLGVYISCVRQGGQVDLGDLVVLYKKAKKAFDEGLPDYGMSKEQFQVDDTPRSKRY